MGVEGKPRVLLTGASGYLGQFLVDALISGSDYEVGATYHSCPEGLPEGVARFEVDFASEASIKDCMAKVCMHACMRMPIPKHVHLANCPCSVSVSPISFLFLPIPLQSCQRHRSGKSRIGSN